MKMMSINEGKLLKTPNGMLKKYINIGNMDSFILTGSTNALSKILLVDKFEVNSEMKLDVAVKNLFLNANGNTIRFIWNAIVIFSF